ncbi:MAG TPA: antibiotic biosynthesis monooxygenase [Bradyrhizobium sp.]|uniref:antibiotic biosynthesis monooxygenase family protein n=1 Tax=Bradyrhizobium sp. TaxID=376 RepID=UPI002C970DEE|nr:antibiotic biosynthesis monooxygenase [Bradyrhizobium sp.]HLZ02916.1 antibiotic biosynthesis monooxygenase [Bradyrhizobium sp.]
MIARLWCGRAGAQAAPDYVKHIAETVFPSLQGMRGHRGAELLRRTVDNKVEFLAVTYWDSLDDIRQFAGSNIELAKIEPRAEELLSDYDSFARHYELVHRASDPRDGRMILPGKAGAGGVKGAS